MSFLEPGGTQVKICGIVSPHDALMCRDAGADALGFNFFPGSSRFLEPAEAIPWIRDLGDATARVAVVVNPDRDLMELIRRAGCFEFVQFHGDESPDDCDKAGFPRWIKAIRVSGPEAVGKADCFSTKNILLDGWTPNAFGGTGQRLDWDSVRDFATSHPDKRFILAGGLDVQNVRQAIRIVRPHAVDVASGVELVKRQKDEYLVRQFIREAKRLRD